MFDHEQLDYFTYIRRTFESRPHPTISVSIGRNTDSKDAWDISYADVPDDQIRSCFESGGSSMTTSDAASTQTAVQPPTLYLIIVEDVPENFLQSRVPGYEEIQLRATQVTRRAACRAVCDYLQVPRERPLSNAVMFRSVAPRYSRVRSDGPRHKSHQVYQVSMRSFSITWSCLATGDIRAIIRHSQNESGSITESLLEDLFHHKDIVTHPMALAMLTYLPMAAEAELALGRIQNAIMTAPLESSFHDFIPESTHSAAVSGIAANIATMKLSWRMLQSLAEMISAECERHRLPRNAAMTKREWAVAKRYIGDQALCCARNACAFVLESDAWQQKTMIQVQALFNHITQQASKQNLGIAQATRTLAQESKKDSTSMKAIAAVTMFFLPGTFLSSLFAIPVFNWNAPPGHWIVGSRLWIYFVFMGPLTVLTICIWFVWYRIMGNRFRRMAYREEKDDGNLPV